MLVLPAVVAAAVIWKSSATPDGKCPKVDALDETVLLANLDDCSSFYSCSDGVPILMHCPDGLHFNDKLDVCDWPQDAGCEGKKTAYHIICDNKKCSIISTIIKADGLKTTTIDEQYKEEIICIVVPIEAPNAVSECTPHDPCPSGICYE